MTQAFYGYESGSADWPGGEAAAERGTDSAGRTPAFVPLSERLPAGIDRRLGYCGDAPFVSFYYEPRGEEVVWEDGRTYGFGSGGWCAFLAVIAPLARRYGADLGDGAAAGKDVLLLDRLRGSAYFAPRGSARRFVGGSAASGPATGGPAVGG